MGSVMMSVMGSPFSIIPLTRAVIEAATQPTNQPATRGGAGGNGGNGGKGGCPGFISLYNSVEKESTVQLLKIHGNGGKAENGGKVGTAGCSRYELVGEEKSNGKPGVDNSGQKCAGNCDKLKEMENNMASILSNTLLTLPNNMEDLSTKILLKHDWPFKFPVFTVNSILDMYLRRISMYTKTNLFSQDRLDYEYRFQKVCEKLAQTSNFNSANLLFLPDVMACSYKMSDVVHTHIHSPQIVVDLKKYLKCCADTIKKLMEFKQLSTLTSCHQKFRKSLQEKINKTKHIIRDTVLPQLSKVKSMFLQQIRQHKNDLNTCLSILKEAQKFESVLKFVSCLQWLTSKAENFIGTTGVRVVTAGLAGVAWFVTALKPSLSPPAAIQGNPLLNQERLQAEIKYLLDRYISLIQDIVGRHPEFKNMFANFLGKLNTLWNNFKACETETQNEEKLSECFCQFYELQTEICEAITKHREQYSEQIDQAHALGVLYIELGVSRANCELYNQTKDTLLNRIISLFSNSSEIRGVENRTELSETIYAPKLKFFLDFIESELAADSYSSSRYWKLKDVLVTLKHNLHSFTEGLPSEKEFELCFIKLELALEQYSELWKSIESSSEQIKLADFIAGSRMIDELEETDTNSELRRKVIQIKMLTRAQLVLLEYHNAAIAIKQWAFPYAEKYTNITQRNALQISQLYRQNNETIKTELRKEADACAQLLKEFKTNFNFEQAIHTREDEIWTTEHFYPDKGTFYQWDCAKFPIEIRKLLVGFPVKLCAKLNENHDGKGAIKTNNTIRLQFRHEDGAEYQTELDNCLKQFNLHMTHDGNSFYKVDGNVYKISHNQLTFVDNAVSGKDVSENNSRSKTKDYLLSPFTEWTFQLVLCEPSLLHNPKSVFTELADKFAHRVVLQLVGTGIYLNEASARWNELKPTNVHSHYQKINDYQSE